MSQYVIEGGNPLRGSVAISGAKNAALGILPAALLTDEKVTLENLPDVNDIDVMLKAFAQIGVKVNRIDNHKVEIDASGIHTVTLGYDTIKSIRASYYLLGALLGKRNEAEVALPGGCNIGSRPIDQHIKGFKLLGANVEIDRGMIIAKAKKLNGSHIFLDKVSVGATINIMMAACKAEGTTIIENCAKEPHVVDVANFLNSMGANIKGAGTDVIRITGVKRLHGTEYCIIPDQIEAGTYMMCAVATEGEILITNVIPKHLEAISAKIIEMGSEVVEYDDAVLVRGKRPIKHLNIMTMPYPGYPTDMQPQTSTVLALGEGTSIVSESIFENRFKYMDELTRMGANVRVEGNIAIIEGVKKFKGTKVNSPDLRAGAALVIAALAADGYSDIENIKYIERGYEKFEEKLSNIGANIKKVDDNKEATKAKFKIG